MPIEKKPAAQQQRFGPSPSERAVLWSVDTMGPMELMRAQFHRHKFAPHWHDEWMVGVIETGVNTFNADRREHFVPAGGISLINPGEVHTGGSASETPLRYRAFYVSAAVMRSMSEAYLQRAIEEPAFQTKSLDDPELAGQLYRAHQALEAGGDGFEAECRFVHAFGNLLAKASVGAAGGRIDRSVRPHIEAARSYIDEMYRGKIHLLDLAAVAGLTPHHLLRAFRMGIGMTPHEYQMMKRVYAAVDELRKGRDIAEIAVAVGYADQSHLNRHFKSILGTTPGLFKKTH